MRAALIAAVAVATCITACDRKSQTAQSPASLETQVIQIVAEQMGVRQEELRAV